MKEGLALLDLLMQLTLGFTIALSGALIPGPLSVFIVTSTVKSGEKRTGLLAALGHCLIEAVIIVMIVLGLTTLIKSPTFQFTVSLLGGGALVVFGALSIRQREKERDVSDVKTGYSSLMGGIVFTVLNATIPVWWATVGLPMLSQALMTTTMLGVLFWVIGHWLADISWFSLLSYSIHKGKRYADKKTRSRIITICGIVMIFLGLFFLSSSFSPSI